MRIRRRSSPGDFKTKQQLRAWNGGTKDQSYAAGLAERVRYKGNPAHKRSPGDFGLSPPAAPRLDKTLCDDAQVLTRVEADALLRSGVTKGLVDARSTNGFPKLIWSVRADGLVFEAQLENATKGDYHGYPMPASDPFRRIILDAARDR